MPLPATTSNAIFKAWEQITHLIGDHWYLPPALAPRRPQPCLFLLGVPRCGSTWLARLLNAHGAFVYNHEIYNPHYCRVCNDQDDVRLSAEHDPSAFRMTQALAAGRFFHMYSVIYGPPWKHWTASHRLIKDVVCLFSIEMISASITARFIVLIRHPAAFADSYLRRNARVNMDHLLEQIEEKAGPSEYLTPLRDQIRQLPAASSWTPLQEIGLFWSLSYTYLLNALPEAQRMVIKYEDLAAAPEQTVEQLCAYAGISMTARLRKKIRSTSSPKTESYTRRKTEDVLTGWQHRLDQSQVDEIMSAVNWIDQNAWDRLYADRPYPSK